jgi:hypothetical protein
LISYRIDRTRRLVEVTGAGSLSPEEISDCQAAIGADPAFDPDFALLLDFRAASLAAMQPTHVRQHAKQDPFGPASPRAMLFRDRGDAAIMSLFRAHSVVAEHTGPVQVFEDVDAALAWIEDVRGSRH